MSDPDAAGKLYNDNGNLYLITSMVLYLAKLAQRKFKSFLFRFIIAIKSASTLTACLTTSLS